MKHLKYEVQEMIYDAKPLLDEDNFYHQRQGEPSELTKKLTYILGDYTRDYPISTMTVGGIGYGDGKSPSGVHEIDDVQFTYPVMGSVYKAAMIAESTYVDGDKPGIGAQPFKLRFTDNWLKRYYIIQSSRGVQAYTAEDPRKVGDYYEYEVYLHAAGDDEFCPISETQAGCAWIDLHTAVAESESRSTESRMAMPGTYKNQMGFLRAGMSWAGNAANKVMKINVGVDNGKGGKLETNVWMDYFMWQFEKEWLSQKEHAAWYSRYNRKANGTVGLKDLVTGKIIPTASGLLEQIQNKSTFSRLTYNGLVNKIGDALFGQNDSMGMNITLYTGRGGMRDIDQAMKREGKSFLTDWGMVSDKFVTGTGRNLMLGGFFDGFYHIDGYTIKVRYNPVFDYGKVAKVQEAGGYIHPESGFPLESHRMVFIDDNDYDGMPNIMHVAQKGRVYLDGVIQGLTPSPRSVDILLGNTGKNISKLLSTDWDKSSYTRMSSCGWQIRRGNRCFDLQCIAGFEY